MTLNFSGCLWVTSAQYIGPLNTCFREKILCPCKIAVTWSCKIEIPPHLCPCKIGYQLSCKNIRIYHEFEGMKEKIGSPIGNTRLAEWWQTVIAMGIFFYPILTRIMDYFSCSPLNTAFYIGKKGNGFQKILNTLRCDMVTSFYHYFDVTDRRAVSVRPTCGCSFFLSFPRGR